MKKRITYLDLAKGAGIILVVLGHMENIDAGLRTWISSFHMPLFFVISGMLIALKKEDVLLEAADSNEEISDKDLSKKAFAALVKKKARGILIPYFWFSLLYIPIDIMNLYINNVDKRTFIQNILDSATFSGISVMWFLPALFIAELTALFIIGKIKVLMNKNAKGDSPVTMALMVIAGLIISVISFLIWNKGFRPYYEANTGSYVISTLLGFVRVIFRGLAMSSHVITGYVMFKIIGAIDDLAGKKYSEGSIRGFSIAAGVILAAVNLGLFMQNGDVDNHFLTVSHMGLYYVCAFLGSMSLILICKGLDSIKPIDFLGRNSLIIMATHLQCYLLYAGILVAIAIDAHVTRAKSYVYMFNSVLFTMLFETVVIIVINRFFPFIIGKGSIKDIFNGKK